MTAESIAERPVDEVVKDPGSDELRVCRSVLVPSNYADGSPIPEEKQLEAALNQLNKAQEAFQKSSSVGSLISGLGGLMKGNEINGQLVVYSRLEESESGQKLKAWKVGLKNHKNTGMALNQFRLWLEQCQKDRERQAPNWRDQIRFTLDNAVEQNMLRQGYGSMERISVPPGLNLNPKQGVIQKLRTRLLKRSA